VLDGDRADAVGKSAVAGGFLKGRFRGV
jgi:hypothetical protein